MDGLIAHRHLILQHWPELQLHEFELGFANGVTRKFVSPFDFWIFCLEILHDCLVAMLKQYHSYVKVRAHVGES